MNSISLFLVTLFASMAGPLFAAPRCNVDPKLDNGGLVAVVSGTATGFAAGPIYVTISNNGRNYSTIADKNGKWALVYANVDPHTSVLCWQP